MTINAVYDAVSKSVSMVKAAGEFEYCAADLGECRKQLLQLPSLCHDSLHVMQQQLLTISCVNSNAW
jgi:cob(I)alamin adenosyltransferase